MCHKITKSIYVPCHGCLMAVPERCDAYYRCPQRRHGLPCTEITLPDKVEHLFLNDSAVEITDFRPHVWRGKRERTWDEHHPGACHICGQSVILKFDAQMPDEGSETSLNARGKRFKHRRNRDQGNDAFGPAARQPQDVAEWDDGVGEVEIEDVEMELGTWYGGSSLLPGLPLCSSQKSFQDAKFGDSIMRAEMDFRSAFNPSTLGARTGFQNLTYTPFAHPGFAASFNASFQGRSGVVQPSWWSQPESSNRVQSAPNVTERDQYRFGTTLRPEMACASTYGHIFNTVTSGYDPQATIGLDKDPDAMDLDEPAFYSDKTVPLAPPNPWGGATGIPVPHQLSQLRVTTMVTSPIDDQLISDHSTLSSPGSLPSECETASGYLPLFPGELETVHRPSFAETLSGISFRSYMAALSLGITSPQADIHQQLGHHSVLDNEFSSCTLGQPVSGWPVNVDQYRSDTSRSGNDISRRVHDYPHHTGFDSFGTQYRTERVDQPKYASFGIAQIRPTLESEHLGRTMSFQTNNFVHQGLKNTPEYVRIVKTSDSWSNNQSRESQRLRLESDLDSIIRRSGGEVNLHSGQSGQNRGNNNRDQEMRLNSDGDGWSRRNNNRNQNHNSSRRTHGVGRGQVNGTGSGRFGHGEGHGNGNGKFGQNHGKGAGRNHEHSHDRSRDQDRHHDRFYTPNQRYKKRRYTTD